MTNKGEVFTFVEKIDDMNPYREEKVLFNTSEEHRALVDAELQLKWKALRRLQSIRRGYE